MLECAQPALDEEAIEGCPVVHLPMDSADDVKFLLEAIYDRRIFEIHKPQPLPVIGGILRLARKYDIEYLRKQAVSYITDDYPSTLDDWDDLRLQETPRINQYPGMPLDLIRLARENDVLAALPSLFLTAALHLDTAAIFDGIQDSEEGDVAPLAPADQRIYVLGVDKLRAACEAAEHARWSEPFPACTSYHCARRRIVAIFKAHSEETQFAALDPWWSYLNIGMCPSCTERYPRRGLICGTRCLRSLAYQDGRI
ncbi:hypothetical protein PLICRDRAFT_512890 [Plicaturopsis crispa FD-325 SS-3]|nr:hypothetical protein PLICRDRAFT_512890 [Plicaturopsis crispa FD-325 SS-3]